MKKKLYEYEIIHIQQNEKHGVVAHRMFKQIIHYKHMKYCNVKGLFKLVIDLI